jgi:L-asparaginase II
VEPIVGVDGCGVPVHGMPLAAVATMYARLADPARQGALVPGITRALGAMRTAPYLVGGRGRDDTAVMKAVSDVVMKEGAEALDCVALLDRGIGVAVKVADGGERAAGPTMIAILDRIGTLDRSARAVLGSRARPVVMGGGEPVGRTEVLADLSLTDRGRAAFAREPRNIG